MNNKISNDVPILFLVFNRPETTRLVFEEIKRYRPKRLFVAADGPRNQNEKIKTDETRSIISDVDWECEVHKLYRDTNLGCKVAVSSAITWFFESVDEGIILEDDCLPDQNFFNYSKELLERYRDNEKVFMISGQKPIGYPIIKNSYIFSKRAYIWGWATWKRSWDRYSLDILLGKDILKRVKPSLLEKPFLKKRIDDINSGRLNTWDLQLEVTQRLNDGLCIIPQKNLVENIGFNISTHTFNKVDILFQKRSKKRLKLPIIHPKKVKSSFLFDTVFIINNALRVVLKKLFTRRKN